ncbi:hypothetical protein LCGC14_2389710, partial [marine sediment metagenome]
MSMAEMRKILIDQTVENLLNSCDELDRVSEKYDIQEELERNVLCVDFLDTVPTDVLEALLKEHKRRTKTQEKGNPSIWSEVVDVRKYAISWVRNNYHIFNVNI